MEQVRGRRLALVAMILGIVSVASAIMFTVYVPFVTGGIAIILASISRGKDRFFSGKARVGMITGVSGIALNIALIIAVIVAFFTVPGIRQQTEQLIQQFYGMSFDELVNQMTQF